MSGFAGIFCVDDSFDNEKQRMTYYVHQMRKRLINCSEVPQYLHCTDSSVVSFAQSDCEPFSFAYSGNDRRCSVVICGIITNKNELQARISEAELVLELYCAMGSNFTRYLSGSYIGIITDRDRKVILLFRNGVGINSVYYAFVNNRLILSTEIKGILELPDILTVLSKKHFAEYVSSNGFPNSNLTFFEDIYSLHDGDCIIFQQNALAKNAPFIHRTKPFTLDPEMNSPKNKGGLSGFSGYSRSAHYLSEIKDEHICNLLLEAAIFSDMPSWTAQSDISLLNAYKQAKKLDADFNCELSNPYFDAAEVKNIKMPEFGPILRKKLNAYLRDTTQPVHYLIPKSTVYYWLKYSKLYEQELFFYLQLCLWINHYKVRIPR